jgi:hypothetical protein
VWTVQKGSMQNGVFVPTAEQRYEISPDEAMMAVSEEQRGFDGHEAANLHQLLDVLSMYCAESVVWWDEGRGTPVQPNDRPKTDAKPDSPKSAPDSKPVRVKQPEPKPKRPYRIPDGHVVALMPPVR